MVSNAVVTIIYLVAFLLYLSTLIVKFGRKTFTTDAYSSTDNIITSRSKNNWITIGSSLYVGAMGSWILSVPIEAAINGSLWAVFLYALGCSLCWLNYIYFGKKLRRSLQSQGFTVLERVYMRYGKEIYFLIAFLTVMYLTIVLTSEFITVGKCYEFLTPQYPRIAVIISVSLFSALYSALGGMPATMSADRIVGAVTVVFMSVTFIGAVVYISYYVPDSYIRATMKFTTPGFELGLCLFIAVMFVELINQGTWQRCYSARSEKDMTKGILFGFILMLISMTVFGIVGCLCKAAHQYGLIRYTSATNAYSLFLLVSTLPDAVNILVLFMIIIFAVSTATYIQTAYVGIFVGFFKNSTSRSSVLYARLLGILANIVSVVIASSNPPTILQAMMYGNILCSAAVPIILLSFTDFCTKLGAGLGFGLSILSILVLGGIFTGTFIGSLTWASFPEGYDYRCAITFFVVFLISGAVCLLTSYAQIAQSKRRTIIITPVRRQAKTRAIWIKKTVEPATL